MCESCVLLHSIPHSTVFIQYSSSSSRWRPVFPLTVLSIKFPSAAVLCCAVRRWCWPMFGQPGKVGRDPVIIRSTTPILHRRKATLSLSLLYSTSFQMPPSYTTPSFRGLLFRSNAPTLIHPCVCRYRSRVGGGESLKTSNRSIESHRSARSCLSYTNLATTKDPFAFIASRKGENWWHAPRRHMKIDSTVQEQKDCNWVYEEFTVSIDCCCPPPPPSRGSCTV